MRDLPVIEDPWIGTTLDKRFKVLGLLGKGGMGAIYRCRDIETGTEMAIKIVLADLMDDPEVVARFEREIKANCEVKHPNVVLTFGHGRTDEGTPYFAMELLKGRPLDEVVDDDGDMSSELVAHIGAQVALGLHAAHERGIVHRDLKPTNVIVADDGTVKVFDFGLSLLRPSADVPESTRLTELDMRIGTPLYMAPEYIEGGEVDGRSDLYALGVLLYECCTGRVPFSGSAYQVLHKHANEAVKPIEERVPGRHPKWLRTAIERLLAQNPSDRPQTGAEAAALLTRPPEPPEHLQSMPPEATPVRMPDDTPEPAPPAEARPEVPEPVEASSGLGRILLPFFVVATAIWHGFGVGTSVGSPEGPLGRSMATFWAAAGVLGQGGNPYDPAQLQAFAAGNPFGKVPGAFHPPTWLLAMSWTAPLELSASWATWLGIQEVFLLASVALLWRTHRSLGRAHGLALLGSLAAMGAVAVGLDQSQPVFVLLLLLVASLTARSDLEAGGLLGLAALVALRAWLLLPLLLVRGRFKAAAAAVGVWALGNAVQVGIHGLAPALGYWTEVVPAMLAGNFSGLGLRIDVFGNHAPAHLFATVFAGPTGQQLSTVALVLCWALGLLVVGGLCALHREAGDAWNERAVAATWLLTLILLPVYGHEAMVPLALPAVALVLAAIWEGRLEAFLAVPVGVAIAVLLYPLEPLRQLYIDVFLPDLPMVAPLLREAKPGALAVLASCTVWLSLPPRSE